MYGAILGDMIGAPYEFDRGGKTKDFPMFTDESQFTDDSVMTVAVAEALLDSMGGTEAQVKDALVRSMQKWGHRYPNAGFNQGTVLRLSRQSENRPLIELRLSRQSENRPLIEENRPLIELIEQIALICKSRSAYLIIINTFAFSRRSFQTFPVIQ